MDIQLAKESDKQDWNSYVLSHPASSFYHLMEWKELLEETFHHKTFYLIAKKNKKTIIGICPLMLFKSSLFGNFMISLPYVTYGGILANSLDVEQTLLSEAIAIGKEQGIDHIEFRHQQNKPLNLPSKTAKVTMVLNLPDNPESLFKNFKSKLRSQIRKPEKEGLTCVWGRVEQVDSFYYVFSRNMRDLGTPVYTKSFFSTILKTFPRSTKICSIFMRNQPIASGFLVHFKKRVEIPWASSLRTYNHLSPNMMLYWNSLKYAVDNGFRQFDFGRSTPGEGTYKFKKQWGAIPQQLYWHYWLSQKGSLPDINPHNPKYKYAIKIWQNLPLCIANLFGPKIVKNIP